MNALDDDDTVFLETEGCAPEPILGAGDLQDDFVQSAQQADLPEEVRRWRILHVAVFSVIWAFNSAI
jgi:hypothetical protein